MLHFCALPASRSKKNYKTARGSDQAINDNEVYIIFSFLFQSLFRFCI